MVNAGKAAGMGALVLSVSTMGILGVNSLASASTSSPIRSSTVSASAALGQSAQAAAHHGCASNHRSIPAGANRAKTIDLDGDGRADTLWNSGDQFGVRTASGATFAGNFANAGGPDAGVEAVKLGDGSKVIMELGRLDYVNAVIDCKIVPTRNKQGHQYALDHGFLHPGASWTFTKINGKKRLVGLQLRTISTKDGFYGVNETPIVLHKYGRTATNGKVRELTHNGHIFMSRSTATKLIAALLKAGAPSPVVGTPGD